MRLQSGSLVPGAWQVEVPADLELRAGRSGRRAVAAFDLAPAQLAYGGTFADALAAAALACEAPAVG